MIDPVWNERVRESDRAMDPLGMNRVTDRLLNDLLQGITTVTPRARYYSFYTWAVGRICERNSAENFSQFAEQFRDLERVYMLSCLAHEEEASPGRNHRGINGSNKGKRAWNETQQELNLDFGFFGHRLGGYGQYYQASLANLGLLSMPPEGGAFEQPTQLGLQVAEAFGAKVVSGGLHQLSLQGRASKSSLQKIGRKVCLCRLRDPEARDRDILRDLFFGSMPEFSERLSDVRRRDTLTLFLFLADVAGSNGYKLTDQMFLDACYFGQMQGGEKVVDVEIPGVLTGTAQLWKMFRAHDHVAFAAEAYFTCFLEFVSIDPTVGKTLEEFLESTRSSSVRGAFSEIELVRLATAKLAEGPLSEVVDAIARSAGISGFMEGLPETSERFDQGVRISSGLNEYEAVKKLEDSLLGEELQPATVYAAGAVLTLVVWMRLLWMIDRVPGHWRWLLRHTGADLSPARYVQDLQSALQETDLTLLEYIDWFVRRYVIEQARTVYLDRAASYTKPRSWFHREGSQYKRDREFWARHRNMRFESTSSILDDLGLVNTLVDRVELTDDGAELLRRMVNEVA